MVYHRADWCRSGWISHRLDDGCMQARRRDDDLVKSSSDANSALISVGPALGHGWKPRDI